jgi:RND family efflux transporter MFP subunit
VADPAQAEFLLRTVTTLLECPDAADAYRLLVDRLQQGLGCRQVVLALCGRHRTQCRIRAISGAVQFDAHSETVRAMQDACQEALVRGGVTQWPPATSAHGQAALAHRQLLTRTDAQQVTSVALRDRQGDVLGVVLVLDTSSPGSCLVPEGWWSPLVAVLKCLRDGERGRVAQLLSRFTRGISRPRGRLLALLVAALVGLLAVPVPLRVGCECVLQPVTRRFVVAPYDGVLDKCLVAPGDVIDRGTTLARMDERELRWELAQVEADCARAEKERDAARAAHRTSAAQLAELDMQRLAVQQRLLQHRLEHLAIRSPIDGVVVAGDLEKAEGAPLTIGQSLFEVAPLDRMLCELSIPEEDVGRINTGMAVRVSLDARAGDAVTGEIRRIHPRAELRGSTSVFVAEVELDNPDGQLRPGMNGAARVLAGRRSVAWLVFHKPWARARRLLGW